MKRFQCIIVKPHRPILQPFSFHPSYPDDDSILQVNPFFPIAFEIIPMVNLINALTIL